MVSVKITNDAIEYMAAITGMEPEDAEEELQTVIGLCKLEATQQGGQADVCSYCDGTGVEGIQDGDMLPCPPCNGTGARR